MSIDAIRAQEVRAQEFDPKKRLNCKIAGIDSCSGGLYLQNIDFLLTIGGPLKSLIFVHITPKLHHHHI